MFRKRITYYKRVHLIYERLLTTAFEALMSRSWKAEINFAIKYVVLFISLGGTHVFPLYPNLKKIIPFKIHRSS